MYLEECGVVYSLLPSCISVIVPIFCRRRIRLSAKTKNIIASGFDAAYVSGIYKYRSMHKILQLATAGQKDGVRAPAMTLSRYSFPVEQKGKG